jgi:hypothetical protein
MLVSGLNLRCEVIHLTEVRLASGGRGFSAL